MFYKIRRGIFETNSSSTHSVTIRKNFDIIQRDTIEVDCDNYVHAKFATFGWGYDRFTDTYTKLQYILTLAYQVNQKSLEKNRSFEMNTNYIDLFYELDDFKKINEVIKERYNCYGIKMDCSIQKECEKYNCLGMKDEYGNSIYGIDHQSIDYDNFEDFLDYYNMTIEEFIFDSDRVLVIDNDNNPHDINGKEVYPSNYPDLYDDDEESDEKYNFYDFKNGNYIVKIYEDGTKIRESEDGTFIPEFAESIDITVTEECDGNCPYCYAGCTTEGKHCDFDKYRFLLHSIPASTEIAINGNDLSHPGLLEFIRDMECRDVIVNMTINEKHFIKSIENNHEIPYLYTVGAISGLGISLSSNEVSDKFIEYVKQFPNAVIHVIAGIVTVDAMKKLVDNNLKVLVLGYKSISRGDKYYKDHQAEIDARTNELKEFLKQNQFNIISFDNLALAQLAIKELLTEDQWNEVYMGNDGEYTFYINLVEGYYAKSSMSAIKHEIDSDNVVKLFQNLKRGE